MFMDITIPYKKVLTTSTDPGVIIIQNGCQKMAVFGYTCSFKIIDTELWIIGHIFINNCGIVMIFGSKYIWLTWWVNLRRVWQPQQFWESPFSKWLPDTAGKSNFLEIILLMIIILSCFLVYLKCIFVDNMVLTTSTVPGVIIFQMVVRIFFWS